MKIYKLLLLLLLLTGTLAGCGDVKNKDINDNKDKPVQADKTTVDGGKEP